jgi:rhodanese-related sulfurtransferase
MKFKVIAVSWMALIMLGLSLFTGNDASAQAPRMTKEELKALLGNQDVIIIDVRQPGQWDDSSIKIWGANREDPGETTESWAMKYQKDKTIVLYCT